MAGLPPCGQCHHVQVLDTGGAGLFGTGMDSGSIPTLYKLHNGNIMVAASASRAYFHLTSSSGTSNSYSEHNWIGLPEPLSSSSTGVTAAAVKRVRGI